MNKEVMVNFDSLSNFSKIIKDNTERIYTSLTDLLMSADEMEKIYTSNAGQQFKEGLIECLDKLRNKCQNFSLISDEIDEINQLYQSTYSKIQESIRG